MKIFISLLFIFLGWASVTFGQPRWSAEVRAKNQTAWMRDSLHLSKDQLAKATKIELHFEQQIDKSSESPASRDKEQQELMRQKDADMKAVFNKTQYQKYYNQQILQRRRERTIYKDGRQPL